MQKPRAFPRSRPTADANPTPTDVPLIRPSPAELARFKSMIHSSAVILRVIDRLTADIASPWRLKDMAAIANFSPHHFRRTFTDIIGIPPRRFLIALRIEAAKELLGESEFSVTRICFEVGYESLGTFTTRFTQVVGVPPSAYRQARRFRLPAGTATLPTPLRPPPRPPRDTTVPDRPSVELAGMVFGHNEVGEVRIGLFADESFDGPPLAFTVLPRPGGFTISGARPGRIHLRAVARQPRPDPLCGRGRTLVGSTTIHVGCHSSDSELRNGSAICLRPMTAIDPPIPKVLRDQLANTA